MIGAVANTNGSGVGRQERGCFNDDEGKATRSTSLDHHGSCRLSLPKQGVVGMEGDSVRIDGYEMDIHQPQVAVRSTCSGKHQPSLSGSGN